MKQTHQKLINMTGKNVKKNHFIWDIGYSKSQVSQFPTIHVMAM